MTPPMAHRRTKIRTKVQAEAQAEEAKAQPEKTRRLERVSVEITLLHCINMILYYINRKGLFIE